MSEEYIIDCKNVKFTYSGAVSPAVNNVSLKIKRGEFVSVIGHNGSGKSTLARLLNGLLIAESGDVCVLGYNLTKDETAPVENIFGQKND